MTNSWAAGSHAVQFYEHESFVHHAIAEFFTQDAGPSDPLILVSRPRTFTAVAKRFGADRYSAAVDTADRIQFYDAEAVLPQIIDGTTLKLEQAERLFKDVLAQAQRSHTRGTIRLYGETVDILCQHGNHATALKLEGLANMLMDLEPGSRFCAAMLSSRLKRTRTQPGSTPSAKNIIMSFRPGVSGPVNRQSVSLMTTRS